MLKRCSAFRNALTSSDCRMAPIQGLTLTYFSIMLQFEKIIASTISSWFDFAFDYFILNMKSIITLSVRLKACLRSEIILASPASASLPYASFTVYLKRPCTLRPRPLAAYPYAVINQWGCQARSLRQWHIGAGHRSIP